MSFSLEELKREYGAQMHWRSYELRPAGSPPIPPQYRARIEAGRTYFEQRALEEHGVQIHQGPFGINSRPALILEKYAESQGKGQDYHKLIERAYWLEAQDISQVEVLQSLLKSAGIETDVQAILSDPHYEQAVDADIMQAQQFGLQGVPAVVFQNRYLVSGAQPYPVFQQVMARVLAEKP